MSDGNMQEIVDKLYLGSVEAAYNTEQLKQHGVTHILSIETCQLSEEYAKDFTVKLVLALDMPENDLLSKFEDCFKFIDEGLSKGGTLVHCLRGASRSATIVIGYIMSKNKLTFKEALDFVKSKRHTIDPNSGFTSQLQLFERMGSRVDPQNELYRRYRLSKLALTMQKGSAQSEVDLFSDLLSSNPSEGQDKGETIYKCRKCRKSLFKSSGIMQHMEGFGEAAFDWRGKLPTNQKFDPEKDENESRCSRSLFIEPVQWMSESILIPEGKLGCPKCLSKLGSFVWYGERCPCGAWVAPAFHIQTNKVDECKPRSMPGMGMVGLSSGTAAQNL